MSSRLFKLLIILAGVSLVAGCKLAVVVPSGGNVTSLSNTRNCTGPNVCEFVITDTSFTESFTAVPKPGYQFVRWQKGTDFSCGDLSTPTCTVSLSGNAAVDAAIITLFNMGYIMPVFKDVGIDTDNDGVRDELDEDDDNDGILDVDDLCRLDPTVNCGIFYHVGGYVYQDTTWAATNGPYIVNNNGVQVPEGVTLTIAEGVRVINSALLQVAGNLVIQGSPEHVVTIDDLHIETVSSTASIEIEYAHFVGGDSQLDVGENQRLIVRHSVFEPGSGLRAVTGNNPADIEFNVFRGPVAAYPYTSTGTINVRNNLFVDSGYIMGGTGLVLELNSFLSVGSPVGSPIAPYNEGAFLAANNYWGTTDESIIESKAGGMEYLPILNEPHPDTPTQ